MFHQNIVEGVCGHGICRYGRGLNWYLHGTLIISGFLPDSGTLARLGFLRDFGTLDNHGSFLLLLARICVLVFSMAPARLDEVIFFQDVARLVE